MSKWFTHAVLGLAIVAIAQPSTPARAKDAGAIIAAGVVGLAVGAAISKHHHHTTNIYYNNYKPPHPPGAYPPHWAASFSPAPGIICYPAQYACYKLNGAFAPGWTRRAFG